MISRRQFVFSATALGILSALGLKPSDQGADYSPYFARLNQLLKQHGQGRPTLLLDLNKLDQNITRLKALIPAHAAYRIVVKSLPSPDLIDYVMQKASTNRLMLFHQPFLNQVARDFPTADVLMGKPMPIRAVNTFYRQLSDQTFDHQKQLQWLIDSQQRLQQYLALAQKLNIKMRINIEIDVGLHRGGLQHPDELTTLLNTIQDNPEHLSFSGFMGYDPHVVKLPPIIKSVDDAFDESQQIYQSFIDQAQKLIPSIDIHSLCLNGAGSPTLPEHAKGTLLNDIAAGSCLVKPSQFDIPGLAQFETAAYIATPVLKKLKGIRIPGIEGSSSLQSLWNPNREQTLFIYGGKWQANYLSPEGLTNNDLFGTSTNQQIVNCSNSVNIKVDDHLFLRPEQSEFVFLQFGDIQTLRDGAYSERWTILT